MNSLLAKKLIFWGALLFLIGVLQGAIVPYFTNTRMALSAHLAAVQSGMALMIFGAIWQHIQLSAKMLTTTYISSIASMYLIWMGLTLAAVLGTSKATPIAGAGFQASPAQEILVEAIITLGAVAGIVASVLIVLGLYRNVKNHSE